MDNKNSFWQSEKGKAAIKLGLWMIFIFVLIAIVIFSERNNSNNVINDTPNNENEEVETPTYEFENYNDMQDKLLKNNYGYVYTITTSDSKYIYTGIKDGIKELGFKEDATGVIKYFVDDTGTYQVNLDNTTLIDTLYQNVDSSYLDIALVFDNLSEFLYSVTKNGDMRTIIYDKEGYQVTVLTDTENITNITITVDTTTYELEFTKIGECATINFVV